MATAEVTVAPADTAITEATGLRIGPECNGILLEAVEFDAAEFEDGWCYELINGVLVVSPSPRLEERDPNEELGFLLRMYARQHSEGSSLDATVSEQTVHIGNLRRRVDRAIWAGLGRLPRRTETPTVTVEFVSGGKRNRKRDYETKRDEYQSAGVREYWIIDRFDRRMTVYRFNGDNVELRAVTAEQSYATPLLPGFELPLQDLLQLADRWNDVAD